MMKYEEEKKIIEHIKSEIVTLKAILLTTVMSKPKPYLNEKGENVVDIEKKRKIRDARSNLKDMMATYEAIKFADMILKNIE